MEKDIRVVIPAFNAGKTIVACLDAVVASVAFHPSCEIIVVDNGRNPELEKQLRNYPVKIIVRNELSSAAYARNEGAKGFHSGILVFIDSDVCCEKHCIEALISPVQKGQCHASIGNYSQNLVGLSFSQKYKQLYINHIYSRSDSEIKNDFWTAIACVDAVVFHKLNGFNTNFKGANGEDQEFGIRLTKNNFNVVSVKQAQGQHRNPYGISCIIKNDFKKGITAVQNSMNNKVSLSDNRHARKADMFAVLFSVLAVGFFIAGFIHALFFTGTIVFVSSWLASRMRLALTFAKTEGLFFCVGALLLMYTLDLVRFCCVIFGVVKNKLSKKVVLEKNTETVLNPTI